MTYGEAALAKNADPFDTYMAVMEGMEGRDLDSCRPGERIFALASRLMDQVNNGGFDQYFFNGGTDYVHETAAALESIGAVRTSQFVRQAIEVAQLPQPVPADFDYCKNTTEEQQERLNELDEQYYDSGVDDDEVYPRLVDYLRAHTDEFV